MSNDLVHGCRRYGDLLLLLLLWERPTRRPLQVELYRDVLQYPPYY